MDDVLFDGYVKLVLDATAIRRACLALGNTIDDFVKNYPTLTHEQAREALAGVVDTPYLDHARDTLARMSDLLNRKTGSPTA